MDDQVGKEGREGGRLRLIANEFSNSFSGGERTRAAATRKKSRAQSPQRTRSQNCPLSRLLLAVRRRRNLTGDPFSEDDSLGREDGRRNLVKSYNKIGGGGERDAARMARDGTVEFEPEV